MGFLYLFGGRQSLFSPPPPVCSALPFPPLCQQGMDLLGPENWWRSGMGLFFLFFLGRHPPRQELNTDWSNLNRGCGKEKSFWHARASFPAVIRPRGHPSLSFLLFSFPSSPPLLFPHDWTQLETPSFPSLIPSFRTHKGRGRRSLRGEGKKLFLWERVRSSDGGEREGRQPGGLFRL